MAKTKTNVTEGVNNCLSQLPVEQQIAMERVRQIIKITIPEAQE
jgi:hypothetical protein